ncbi:MAG: hypothetical protein JST93_15495 [Acidobacteria bacterium]|nr:hypothetical protein [Acidobacteriota bacterium]
MTLRMMTAILGLAAAALAGPPVICERIEIGNAKSLPWRNVNGWDGTEKSYDVAKLTADTVALLEPSMPLSVRMETLRRAAIYAAKHEMIAEQLSARLLARVADGVAAGKQDPLAWFDAGYYAEALRQVTFVYRYDMLSAEERQQWKLRGDKLGLDGRPWVEKAIRLGGRGMEVALVKMEGYRETDLKQRKQVAVK